MDAAQIVMMPLVGAVPATTSASPGSVLTEQPLAEQFSQLLDDVLKGAGLSSSPTPELISEHQDSASSQQPETSVLPATDSALQQMMANFVPILQPVQPQLQVEPSREPEQPELKVEQPQGAAQVELPKVAVQVEQPQVAVQAEQLQVEVQVEQPQVAVQVEQPKVAVQVEQPKVAVQVEQPQVAVQVEQPKVAGQVEQPRLAAQVEQTKIEAQVEQAYPKKATEWWSYGRPAAAQQVTGLQIAANPDLSKNAVVIEKPTSSELLQSGSSQAAVTAPVAGEALSMGMGTDSNPQGKAFSEGMLQQPSLSVSATAQKSEALTAEKSVENPRSALPEQISRQVTERLSTHEFRQGKENLSLTLTPEHLGKIQMNFQMDQQNLRVEIVAENRVAREALMQQVDSLKESLARQNVTVEKFEVTTNSGKEFQQQYQQPQQQQALYSSLYDRHGANRTTATNLSEGGGEYQLPEGMQYFAPQYESTFTYRA